MHGRHREGHGSARSQTSSWRGSHARCLVWTPSRCQSTGGCQTKMASDAAAPATDIPALAAAGGEAVPRPPRPPDRAPSHRLMNFTAPHRWGHTSPSDRKQQHYGKKPDSQEARQHKANAKKNNQIKDVQTRHTVGSLLSLSLLGRCAATSGPGAAAGWSHRKSRLAAPA